MLFSFFWGNPSIAVLSLFAVFNNLQARLPRFIGEAGGELLALIPESGMC